MGFIACPEIGQYTQPEIASAGAEGIAHIFHRTFLVGSEGGFISSRSVAERSEAPWRCDIPGGLATLTWPS
jgi:hypothetical protein